LIDLTKVNKDANLWSYITLKGDELIRIRHDKRKEYLQEKLHLIEEIVKISGKLFEGSKLGISKMLDEIKNALNMLGYNTREVEVKLISRGLFGSGSSFGKLAFEVGLSFDSIFNVPYIPSSSLKGAVRAAYFTILLQSRLDENKARERCEYIFGGPNVGAGLVGFTDAYPIQPGEKGYLLYPDVITPHYTEEVASELDVKPTPITYLTVAPNTHFQFYIFWRNRHSRGIGSKDFSKKPSPNIEELGSLDLAVLLAMRMGVGAKTMLGYSTFELVRYE
jgi:CRISPR-associated protein Cmr6